MNNPTIDNDLQRAIDDITKNTNSDPVFADPVAAPAPVTPVAPAQAPTPARPINNFSRSSFTPPAPKAPTFMNEPLSGPVSEPAPTFEPPVTFTPAPAPEPAPISIPEPITSSVSAPTSTETTSITTPDIIAPDMINFSTPATETVSETIVEETEIPAMPTEFDEIKRAALRDLSKVIDKLDVSPNQKFDVYKKVHDDFGDDSIIAPAYKAATEIKDDKERGEALLYLVNSLDK